VSTFFVSTDDCGLCCKSSTESFRIIIFWRNIEVEDFDRYRLNTCLVTINQFELTPALSSK
ncbi:unnamed protein product, partial [Porites evermanni]